MNTIEAWRRASWKDWRRVTTIWRIDRQQSPAREGHFIRWMYSLEHPHPLKEYDIRAATWRRRRFSLFLHLTRNPMLTEQH
jgi:hypothetical protein